MLNVTARSAARETQTTTFEGLERSWSRTTSSTPRASREHALTDIELDSSRSPRSFFSLEDKYDVIAKDQRCGARHAGAVAKYIDQLIAERDAAAPPVASKKRHYRR